jgi:hypothetical protein
MHKLINLEKITGNIMYNEQTLEYNYIDQIQYNKSNLPLLPLGAV